MIENHAAMKWERLANEYLKERDECMALATKNRETADALRARVAELEKGIDTLMSMIGHKK